MSKKSKEIVKKFKNGVKEALDLIKELDERKPKVIAHLFATGEKNGEEWEVIYNEPKVAGPEGEVLIEKKKKGRPKKEKVCVSMKD